VRSERTAKRCARLLWCDSWPGVEDTSAEQIAADAGVSLRTFYRTSAPSMICCLLTTRDCIGFVRRWTPDGQRIDHRFCAIAVFSFPYDVDAVAKIAALRTAS